jgi:hypothetical protein
MVWTAGKEKTFERMVDTWVAVVGNRSAGCKVCIANETAADIQNGRFVQHEPWAACR